jgi:glycogen(starch) synthase
VLMTADAVGGVWTYALELARALAPFGVEITLAVMGPAPHAAQRAAAREIPGLTLEERRYRLEWMDDPWGDLERSGEWLMRLAARIEPHVIHLNSYALAALPWTVPVCVVAHSCVCTWWRAVRGGAAPAAWDRYRAAVRRGLACADIVVAPTAAMVEALRREYGLPGAARVIPNGRSATRFVPLAKEPIVLSVGRLWDEAKNVAAVERAARAIPWPVYLAGDLQGPTGDRYEPRCARYLGRLGEHDVATWMGRAAIYALPARYEPFGLSPLEAALAGCALVLGDIPSLREIWGDAARYVSPDDEAGLVDVIADLAGDPCARRALAARGRLRARRYSPARMAAAYHKLYTNLTAGCRRSRRTAPGDRACGS